MARSVRFRDCYKVLLVLSRFAVAALIRAAIRDFSVVRPSIRF